MPRAANGNVELEYVTTGDPDGVPLLLVMGLGAQLVEWDDELCDSFADRGFYVLRHDNRDVGLSTKFHEHPVDVADLAPRFFAGEALTPPYTIEDMAADAAAVLDHAGIESAHVLGASMGGMIAQAFAIAYPERTRSLVSIMSTTGDLDVGQPHAEALGALMVEAATTPDAIIEQSVEVSRVVSSPVHFDEDRARRKAVEAYERSHYPAGRERHLFSIVTCRSRTEGLRRLDVPSLVIHGELDPLVDVSGGHRTHEALRNSELVLLPEAAHDLPMTYWPELIERVTVLASSADAARPAAAG